MNIANDKLVKINKDRKSEKQREREREVRKREATISGKATACQKSWVLKYWFLSLDLNVPEGTDDSTNPLKKLITQHDEQRNDEEK